MKRRNRGRVSINILLLLTCSFILYSCSDITTLTENKQAQEQKATVLNGVATDIDEIRQQANRHYYQLAEIIPGFGGVYLEEKGTSLVIKVTNPENITHREDLIQEVRKYFREESPVVGSEVEGGIQNMDIRIDIADYEYTQLQSWLDDTNFKILDTEGVTFTSVSHNKNRIRIGVEEDRFASQIDVVLSRFNIPLEAIDITITGPFLPDVLNEKSKAEEANSMLFSSHTLQDMIRPLPGGVENRVYDLNGNPVLSGPCTVSFNLAYPSMPRNWMTNSHCTRAYFTVHPTDDFYQASISDGNPGFIGYETWDPYGTPCGSRNCRWSDAASMEYPSGFNWDIGMIARTQFHNSQGVNTPGSIDIDQNNSRFTITQIADDSDFFEGQVLHKMGRTTGWTIGSITGTCVNANVGSSHRLLCQELTNYYSLGGDSGAPVFRRITGGDVEFFGVHWGAGDSSGSPRIFSRITGVQEDINQSTQFSQFNMEDFKNAIIHQ